MEKYCQRFPNAITRSYSGVGTGTTVSKTLTPMLSVAVRVPFLSELTGAARDGQFRRPLPLCDA